MKVIPKLLNGGFMSLFTQYTPILMPASSEDTGGRSSRREQRSEDKESTKGKLTEKELFELISKVKGLPNDMQALANNLEGVFEMQELNGTSDIADLANIYRSSLLQLTIAAFNKEEYDRARQTVESNEGLNEYAVTDSGMLVAIDKKDKSITQIDVNTFLKNSDKYNLLTNSNLLYMRAWQPLYANSNEILITVSNGIGISKIDQLIRAKLSSLGEDLIVRLGYIIKLDDKIVQGLKVLLGLEGANFSTLNGMTLNGVYEQNIIKKNLKQQAEAALLYIYNTLPTNAKTILLLRSLNTSNPKQGALDTIFQLITSRMSETDSSKPEYLGDVKSVMKKGKSGGSGGSEEDSLEKLKLNTATKWLAGMGDKQTIIFNTSGTSKYTATQVNTMPVTDMNGNYLGANSTLQKLTEGLYNSILDTSNASMGMIRIDPSSFKLILLTDGNISSVDFPCIEKEDGTIVPDLSIETVEKKKKAEEELKRMGISLNDEESIKNNYATINKVYKDNNLSPAYNNQGKLVSPKWRRFGVLNGKACNEALRMNQVDRNRYLVEDIDEINIQNYMDVVGKETWDDRKWLGISEVDHLWSGPIWIPVKVDYNSALAGESIYPNLVMELERRTLALHATEDLTLGRLLLN